MSALEAEIAEVIVTALHLEISPSDIVPHEPLFGEGEGLGLDSIDALELALELGEKYGVEFDPEDENNARIFASLTALADHVARHRTT